MDQIDGAGSSSLELTVEQLLRGVLTLEQSQAKKVFKSLQDGLENLVAQNLIPTSVAKQFRQLRGKILEKEKKMKKYLELPEKIEVLGCPVTVRYLHNNPVTKIHAYGVEGLRQNPPGGKAFISLPDSFISRWDELKKIEPPFFGNEWEVAAGFPTYYTHPWNQTVEDARLEASDSLEKWQRHCKEKPELFEQEKKFWLEADNADSFFLPAPIEEIYGTDQKGNPLIAILQVEARGGHDCGFLFKAYWHLNRFEAEANKQKAVESVETSRKYYRIQSAVENMIMPDDPYDPAVKFPEPQKFEDGWIALVEDYDEQYQSFMRFEPKYFRNYFDDEVLLEEAVMAQWEKAKARFEGLRTCRLAAQMAQEYLEARNLRASKKFSGMFESIREGKLGLGQGTYGGDWNNTNFFAAGHNKRGGWWDMSFRLSETRLVQWQFGSDHVADIEAVKAELEKGILKESVSCEA